MTPAEINRRLALAIGYAPEDVRLGCGGVLVCRHYDDGSKSDWLEFDCREPRTIYPIAEKYRVFPVWAQGNGLWRIKGSTWTWHTCPRACIALAVIEMRERGLPTWANN